MTPTRVLVLVLAALVPSCVDRGSGPQGKKIEASYIRENLLTEVPAGIERVDVDLGGKVVYVGSRITNRDGTPTIQALAPGATIRVLHYWQVKQPIGKGWRIFRLLRGAPGSADFMNLDPTDMEIGHPPHKWKAGQIIQDVQEIVLRPDWRSPQATLHVGLIADDGHQLGDRMRATGARVVDRAVVARTIAVDLAKAPPPLGTIHLPRAAGPIVVDGVATDPGWSNAVTSPELVTADGSSDPVGKTLARMTWDDQNLYVFVQITDTDIYSEYKTHDEPIWKQDVIELFIDADANRRGYVELQVNPNNTTFDSYFATTRAQPGDESWESGMVTAVKVRGTADKAGDRDHAWDVEIAIPLAAVKGRDDAMNVRLPPQVGDRWRLNVVRVDYRSNGGNPAVASWNRIGYGDFHALDRMLTVIFADPTGSIVRPDPGAGPTVEPVPGAATTPASGSAAPPGSGSAAPPASGSAASGSAAPASGSAAPAPAPAKPSASPPKPPASGSAAASAPGSASVAPVRGAGASMTVAPPTGAASGSAGSAPKPGAAEAPRSGAGSGSGSATAPSPK